MFVDGEAESIDHNYLMKTYKNHNTNISDSMSILYSFNLKANKSYLDNEYHLDNDFDYYRGLDVSLNFYKTISKSSNDNLHTDDFNLNVARGYFYEDTTKLLEFVYTSSPDEDDHPNVYEFVDIVTTSNANNYHSHLYNSTSTLEFTLASPPSLHTFIVTPKIIIVSSEFETQLDVNTVPVPSIVLQRRAESTCISSVVKDGL
jgi:hypothetical protein